MEKIRAWWARPGSEKWNVGVATGQDSDLVVLDVDSEAALQELCLRHNWKPNTFSVRTGRGLHLYFRHPGGWVPGSVGSVAEGIDLRGERCCVVAVGSRHHSGSKYEPQGDPQQIEVLPDFLGRSRSTPNRELTARVPASVQSEAIYEGSRNQELFKRACSLRAKGYKFQEIYTEISQVNQCCVPPLEDAEITTIARSASRYTKGEYMENTLHWFKRDVAKWCTCPLVQSLTDTQTGWHVRLEMAAFMSGGYLPTDTQKLLALARAKSKTSFEKQYMQVLADCRLVEHEGKEVWLMPSAHEAYEAAISRSEKGRASRAAALDKRRADKAVEGGSVN